MAETPIHYRFSARNTKELAVSGYWHRQATTRKNLPLQPHTDLANITTQ